jgi:hypothetical protein
LKKCANEVEEKKLTLAELDVKDDLTYKEHLIKIVETSHSEGEASGKEKMSLWKTSLNYSQIFLNLEDEILFKG